MTLTGGNSTLQANFVHTTRQLTLQTDGTAGAVITPSSPATVNDGASTPISVTVPSGYTFAGWTVTVGPSYAAIANASLASTTVTLSGGNATVQANFANIPRQLTVNTDGTTGAVVSPSGTSTVNEGAATPISVTTVPVGYAFLNWTVTAGGTNATIANASLMNTTVTLSGGNGTVQANFIHITRQLTVQTDGTAGAMVNPSGMVVVNEGAATPISVTTIPTGYSFVNWTVTVGGANATIANASSLSTTVTLSGGNATVRANFAQITRQLTVQTDGTAGAVVSPAGDNTVVEGAATPISVTTVPAGYSFVNWTVTAGGANATIANASSANTTVTLSGGNATVQANFALDNPAVNRSDGWYVGCSDQSFRHTDCYSGRSNTYNGDYCADRLQFCQLDSDRRRS